MTEDRTNVFRRICGWCDKPLNPEYVHSVPVGTAVWRSERDGNVLVTHGICPACHRKQMVDLYHSLRTHEQSPATVRKVLGQEGGETTRLLERALRRTTRLRWLVIFLYLAAAALAAWLLAQ